MGARLLIAVLAAGLLLASMAAAQNVYRWTDEDGKVHYSKTIPPEYADRPHDILSPSGILIRRVTDPLAREAPVEEKEIEKENKPKPLYSEFERQVRSDRLLLLKYHSEDEILQAMQLEVDQLSYDLRILEKTHSSIKNSLYLQISSAADRQRAGLEVEPGKRQDIDKLRQRLIANKIAATRVAERERQIREKFENDLERYRFLQDDSPG